MNPPPSLQIIQELYAAFSRGDLPSLLARLHPDVAWAANVDSTAPGAAGIPCYQPGRGRAFVAAYFAALAQSYDMREFSIRTFLAGGAEVAVRIEVEFVVRSTGRLIRTEVLHHWMLDAAGLVTRFRDFEDTLGFVHAWGGWPATSG